MTKKLPLAERLAKLKLPENQGIDIEKKPRSSNICDTDKKIISILTVKPHTLDEMVKTMEKTYHLNVSRLSLRYKTLPKLMRYNKIERVAHGVYAATENQGE